MSRGSPRALRSHDMRILAVMCLCIVFLSGLIVERHFVYAKPAKDILQENAMVIAALKGKDMNVVKSGPVSETLPEYEGREKRDAIHFEPVAKADIQDRVRVPTPQPTVENLMTDMCVVVRAKKDHSERLSHLVESLIISARQTPTVRVHILLLDVSQDGQNYQSEMKQYVAELTKKEELADPKGNSTVQVLNPPPMEDRESYSYSDWARDHLREREECEYIMHTTGTNYYISTFTLVIEPVLKEGKHLIAFDYITHDRNSWEIQGSTNVVSVRMRKGYVDAGSVVISRELALRYASSDAEELAGKNLAARDFQYIKRLSRLVTPHEISLIHRTLLVLQ